MHGKALTLRAGVHIEDQKLLNYLVKHKHTSPFRGVVFKWQVKAPLFVARQWWKHVIGGTYANDQLGWNEKSFRYCVADDEEFYMPNTFRRQSENNKQASSGPLNGSGQGVAEAAYSDALLVMKDAYRTLLDAGVSKEQARVSCRRVTTRLLFGPAACKLCCTSLACVCQKTPSGKFVLTPTTWRRLLSLLSLKPLTPFTKMVKPFDPVSALSTTPLHPLNALKPSQRSYRQKNTEGS